jgi:tRNA(Ile)-lysidine synthase
MDEPPDPIVTRTRERVREQLNDGERYLALVSGGRDSVCLLDVLVELAGAARVSVLHVNYELRGEQSQADEAHVRALCRACRVRCTVERPGPPPPAGNLQAWARAARYGAAERLAQQAGALIAAGHTASDQAETILYRLAASPGRRALLGMRERDGRLIRPLLGLTRAETAAYCTARGLAWREDASNLGARFARGRVRNELLAAMRAVHPAAEANLLRSTALLRDEAEVLDRLVAEFLRGRSALPLDELRSLDPALARLAVVALAEDGAGRYLPAVANRLTELYELASAGGSASLDVGAGTRAVVEYGRLRFEHAPSPAPAAESLLPLPGAVHFGAWALTAELADIDGVAALAQRRADGSTAILDADRLGPGPLRVRGWRPGDVIRPIGLRGAKSLADLFTDRRLPRASRATTPVLVRDEEIIWVARLATAECARVTPATRRVALITAADARQ